MLIVLIVIASLMIYAIGVGVWSRMAPYMFRHLGTWPCPQCSRKSVSLCWGPERTVMDVKGNRSFGKYFWPIIFPTWTICKIVQLFIILPVVYMDKVINRD